MVKSALVESAVDVLGKAKGSQSVRFCESEKVIKPYITTINTLYSKWLGSSNVNRI